MQPSGTRPFRCQAHGFRGDGDTPGFFEELCSQALSHMPDRTDLSTFIHKLMHKKYLEMIF